MSRRFECGAIIGCNPAVLPGVDYSRHTPIGINRQRRGFLYKACFKVGTSDPDPISLSTFEDFCRADATTKLPEEWPFDSRLQEIPLVIIFVKTDCFDYLSSLPCKRWKNDGHTLAYQYEDRDLRIDRHIPLMPFLHHEGNRFFYWIGDENTEGYLATAWARTLIKDIDQQWVNLREALRLDPNGESERSLENRAWRAISCAENRSNEIFEGYKRLIALYLQRYGEEGAKKRFHAGVNVQLRTTNWEDFLPKCEELRKTLMED